MRITSKGQVTIPAEIRAKAGLMPNTEVDFILKGKEVRIVRRGKAKKPTRGQRAVEKLWGSATRSLGMSVDEYLDLTRDRDPSER
ncbi:MAG TPA: AbrB/MazE/SpoVT family DNA-binding domain-containing protein [Dongiaceae bacterium]|nr:AbrB/MazE/SpoVT family DNA-binding domain-containing protein [Dongiaceae bacterium]